MFGLKLVDVHETGSMLTWSVSFLEQILAGAGGIGALDGLPHHL
jgi:hypothetical protein